MKLKNIALAAIASLAAVTSSAWAILPPAVGTTVTAMQTDGQAIFDLVFPVVGVFVGLALTIKLFKRFTHKI